MFKALNFRICFMLNNSTFGACDVTSIQEIKSSLLKKV